jgi:signal transduction histidine kinase/DNA-binding response OmpR family regulator
LVRDAAGGLWRREDDRCVRVTDPTLPDGDPKIPDRAPLSGSCPAGLPLPRSLELVVDRFVISHGVVAFEGERVVDLGVPIRGALAVGDDLWIATVGRGLVHVRPRVIEVIEAPAGRSPIVVRLAWDVATRSVWARDHDGLWWSTRDPQAAIEPAGLHDATRGEAVDRMTLPLPTPPGDGAVRWWATQREVRRELGDGRLETLPGPEPFWQAHDHQQLPDGTTLLATSDGVWRARSNGWAEVLEEAGGRLPAVRTTVPFGNDTVFLGGPEVGLLSLRTNRATVVDLGVPVRHLRMDGDSLWIATENLGLCVVAVHDEPSRVLASDRWRCLSLEQGLGRVGVHASAPDGSGQVWLSSNHGIGVAPEAALRAFARGERDQVGVEWLGVESGLRSAEANGYAGGAVLVTEDGSVYFPTQRGVARVVPGRYRRGEAPVAHFDAAWVDGEAMELGGAGLVVAADRRLVELRWSAVQLDARQGLLFQHRLAGDRGWSTPSADRSVHLRGLGPTTHRFELRAGVGDAWGPVQTLVITRLPTLLERPWVQAGLVSFGVLFALAGVTLQGERSRRRASALQRRVDEATASAREAQAHLAVRNEELAMQADLLRGRNEELDLKNVQLDQNVEELAAQAARLQQLDQLKRRLIANISHELRTPLALVRAPLDVLLTGEVDPDRRRNLQLADHNAARLQRLIEELLLLSKAQSGGVSLRFQRVEVRGLLERVLARFPSQRVRLRSAPTDVGLWCDPAVLDTALGNLIANALEHGGDAAPAEVEGSLEERAGVPGVCVAVRDHGPGVAEHERELIFERFHQVGARPAGGGLGLGLALTRELTELHGGELDLRQPPEGGACFRLWIPLGVAHLSLDDLALAPRADRPPDPAEPPPTGEVSVLLVEDNDELRVFLRDHLTSFASVHAVADAEAALDHLAHHVVRVLVSDVMLPGISGLDLARRVRAEPRLRDMPVLLISARAEVEDRLEGLELADDYLVKPFSVRELRARVEALVRRSGGAPPPPGPGRAERAAWEIGLITTLEEHVAAHLSDPTLDPEQLARSVAMSQRTLSDRMAQLGLPSPAVWIRERRLAQAEELLRAGTYQTVSEVAAAVGMSRSYFTRVFRARTGRAPGSW